MRKLLVAAAAAALVALAGCKRPPSAPRVAPGPPACPSGMLDRKGDDETGAAGADGIAYWCENGYGVREGFYEARYMPSQRVAARGQYTNGKRTGEWTTWFESGAMSQRATFVDDVVLGRLEVWDENGQVLRDEVIQPGAPPPTRPVFAKGKPTAPTAAAAAPPATAAKASADAGFLVDPDDAPQGQPDGTRMILGVER